MARDKGAFRLANSWSRFAWLTCAAIVGIALALGFLVLDRYQQNDPTLGLWGAICRGLGITADIGPAREAAPPLRVPSRIAWTSSTLGQIRAGNAHRLTSDERRGSPVSAERKTGALGTSFIPCSSSPRTIPRLSARAPLISRAGIRRPQGIHQIRREPLLDAVGGGAANSFVCAIRAERRSIKSCP
jgi:hypothetical protein